MRRSKAFALIALLGALIVGGAVGLTADRVLGRDPCTNPTDRGAMRRFLAEEARRGEAEGAADEQRPEEKDQRQHLGTGDHVRPP